MVWIAAVLGTSADAATPPRLALVIGNGAYETSPLADPVNDARLIAQTLRQLDFEVLEHLDLNQKELKRAIQLFGDRLELAGAGAVGLFYYAGHGVQVNGRNYLIPTDAAIDRETDVDIEAVATDTVLAQMEFANNDLNFVILDACRNNPYTRSFRSASRGLARMDAPRGTLISYATAPGDVALDGNGEHSPYSRALAKAMLKPGMPSRTAPMRPTSSASSPPTPTARSSRLRKAVSRPCKNQRSPPFQQKKVTCVASTENGPVEAR